MLLLRELFECPKCFILNSNNQKVFTEQSPFYTGTITIGRYPLYKKRVSPDPASFI
jgi:hypothetical protein